MATKSAKDVWLNTQQAAEMLGLKPQTLAVWRMNGRKGLAYHKTGWHVRYKLSDVEAYIERNRFNG